VEATQAERIMAMSFMGVQELEMRVAYTGQWVISRSS
jgi:hypothetical protein